GKPQASASGSSRMGPVNAATGEDEQLTPVTRAGSVKSARHADPGRSRTALAGPAPATTSTGPAASGPGVRRLPALTPSGPPSTVRLPFVRNSVSASTA